MKGRKVWEIQWQGHKFVGKAGIMSIVNIQTSGDIWNMAILEMANEPPK